MTLLHLQDLTCCYGGGLHAVDHVTLTIAAGSVHAVIGPNGAGKTTLLNLIAGTLRPTSGRIVLNGRDVTRLTEPRRARLGVARTFQHPAVVAAFTAADNVALALTGQHPLRAAHRAATTDRVHAALARTGLHQDADTPAGALPYGRRRLLELTVALAAQPALLLLDEPSAGLDPTELARLTALLRGRDRHVTVILVDHHLDLIFGVADTITVLHHGQHLATGSPTMIGDDPQVRRAYLPPTDRQHPRTQRAAAPPGPPILSVHDLHAGYQDAPILHGVDLHLTAGEILAVVGRNGAGKTTLVNAITGLHPTKPPTTVRLANRTVTGLAAHQLTHAGLSVVPQGRRLFTGLTVAEHLTIARPGTPRPAALTREQILNLFPALTGRLRHRAEQLSGGEQQMLAIARALRTGPRVLVLDEPSEGLAPQLIDQLAHVLGQLAARGLAVLLTEQHLDLVAAIADRVTVLADGHLRPEITGTQVRANPTAIQDLLAIPTAAARATALTPDREPT